MICHHHQFKFPLNSHAPPSALRENSIYYQSLLKNSLFNVKFTDFQLKDTWIDIPKLRGMEIHINK